LLTLCDLAKISPSTANEAFVLGLPLMIPSTTFSGPLTTGIRKRLDGALVVGAIALRNEGGWTVTLEVGNGGHRRVNRKLLVVDTKTVTVGVGIREQTRLEDGVCRRLDVRNQVRGGERSLLNKLA
jgi:hypothetical protein